MIRCLFSLMTIKPETAEERGRNEMKDAHGVSDQEYIRSINFLLVRMTVKQLRYILYNVNSLFCGGNFREAADWELRKMAAADVSDAG